MRDQEIVKLMKDLPFFKPFSVKEMKTIANLDSHIVEYKNEVQEITVTGASVSETLTLFGESTIDLDETMNVGQYVAAINTMISNLPLFCSSI